MTMITIMIISLSCKPDAVGTYDCMKWNAYP